MIERYLRSRAELTQSDWDGISVWSLIAKACLSYTKFAQVYVSSSGDALFVVSYNPTTPNSWPESPFLTRDPHAAVDGLVPGKKYTFHVKAVVNNVESKRESVSTILPLPEQPTNVVIDEVTSNSMHISWESPHDDAQFIVNVMDTAGSIADFPLTVDDKEVTIDNLQEGETYKVTIATTVDGYTTDKHATQVETYADTTDTMLFPLDLDETAEEAQEKVR